MTAPLTDKINALTAYANTVTGGSDTTLSDAVESLASGYGQRGITITDEVNATGMTCVITTSRSEPAPSVTYETLYDNPAVNINPNSPEEGGGYCFISSLGDVYITEGSVWRLTIDGTAYVCTAFYASAYSTYVVGGNGDGCPMTFANLGWGAWVAELDRTGGTFALKVERAVSS